MRSTEFWDFLTPSPSLCPQNLYCLSANFGLFFLPPSSRTSYIEAPLCSYGCPFVPDIVTLLKGCKVVFVVGLARRRTETKMKSTAWRRRISEQLEVGTQERGGDRRHGVTEQFRHALEKGRRVKGVIALKRPRVLVHCHSLPPLLFFCKQFWGQIPRRRTLHSIIHWGCNEPISTLIRRRWALVLPIVMGIMMNDIIAIRSKYGLLCAQFKR